MELKVTSKRSTAQDILVFELRDPKGGELPAFTAGAHLTVRVPSGMKRNYSLSNAPSRRDVYEIAVKRDINGRGGSISMADGVNVGDLVSVSVPRNNFELVDRASEYIFVAGGIGITPILSMMRHLLDNGHNRFKLYYCTRDAETTAFKEELMDAAFAGKVALHHDRGDMRNAFDFWTVFEKPRKAHIYCCGPNGLMDSVRGASGHWPFGSVHFESFGAERVRSDNKPFTVYLQRSEKSLLIPSDRSVLDVLRENGHYVPSSCEGGTCGSCRVQLLQGQADHRDMVLSDAEKATSIMVCVSRAESDKLVIDL